MKNSRNIDVFINKTVRQLRLSSDAESCPHRIVLLFIATRYKNDIKTSFRATREERVCSDKRTDYVRSAVSSYIPQSIRDRGQFVDAIMIVKVAIFNLIGMLILNEIIRLHFFRTHISCKKKSSFVITKSHLENSRNFEPFR